MNSKDELYYSAIDLLHRLIRTPSISREEDAAAQIICETLQKNRFTPYRAGNNVWTFAREFDSEKPTVLLNSHIDTVKPTDSWSRPPFVPIEEDNQLYGLGSNDAGASVLQPCFFGIRRGRGLRAKRYCQGSGTTADYRFRRGRRTHGYAARRLRKRVACTRLFHTWKVGTRRSQRRNQRLVQSHRNDRSPTNIRVSTRFRFIGKSKTDCYPIQAGTQHNVIPDRCDFVVDVRTNDRYTNAEAVEILKSRFPEVKITPRSLRLNSSAISMQHPFVRRALLAGYKPFGSPTLSDQALMPFPSVKMGPGDSSRSHTADEYIILEEIREAIEVYICLLDRLQIEKSAQ